MILVELAPMLFDLTPKEKISELFDRKREIEALRSAMARDEKLTVVYGIRRMGKTSLIRSFISEKDFLSIFLDVRQIYYTHKSSVPSDAVYEQILRGFMDLLLELGISTDDQIGMFSAGENNITNLLSDINKWCLARKVKFLLAIDEAQYLRFSRKVSYDGVIAWSLDNLSNVFFVVSGSEVGVLREMLDFENVKAPLYGRFKNEILLKKFNNDESTEFLRRGFEEQGRRINEKEINQTLERIGGLIGWLAYYGHYRTADKMDHDGALDRIFSEGSRIAMSEVDDLIKRSKNRYMAIMIAISKGMDSWADIKAYTVGKVGKIPDSGLDMLLSSLIKFSIVEKSSEGNYIIVDPILKQYLLSKNRQ